MDLAWKYSFRNVVNGFWDGMIRQLMGYYKMYRVGREGLGYGRKMEVEMYHDCRKRRKLYTLLSHATVLVDQLAENMATDQHQWQRTILGHNFSVSRSVCEVGVDGCSSVIKSFKSWMYAHEDVQVMMASVLVVVGLWWLVRAVLKLIINLICPLLVVLLAVVCVPQLRAPLLGQNYPALANLLRNILMKMAEKVEP